MSTYLTREKYFAHRLTRLLFKSCAAQSIGQDAVLLIIHIVHTEDAARYQGPVRFWNSQLNEVLGFRSPKSLNNARSKAVNAGWLVYERKNDRTDGLYFTTIPPYVERFDDSPIESIRESVPSTERESEQKTERESYALRNGKVTGYDPPPIPTPIPNPNEEDDHQLTSWVDWWNGLSKDGFVKAGCRKTSSLAKDYRRGMANEELRYVLADRPGIEAKIKASTYVRSQAWFKLSNLFNGKNGKQEWYLLNLMDGLYDKTFGTQTELGAGVNYQGGECKNEF
jgi:hypothetical protein